MKGRAMFDRCRELLLGLVLLGIFSPSSLAEQPPPCRTTDPFFEAEVWAKVGERTCFRCHSADGDAADSAFLLQDTSQSPDAVVRNRTAFHRMALIDEDGTSRLLRKATGGLDHGGGVVLKADSTGLRLLERFVRQSKIPPGPTPDDHATEVGSFFDGIEMMSPERLLRRITLSLAGRLPTDSEQAEINNHGMSALDAILDQLMREDAFYERLKEGFNDIFLTIGYPGGGEDILAYDNFEKTRLWYQKHNLDDLPEKDRQRARWDLARVYREALRQEPLELIEHIVRHDHPFTEIVTADYIMVSPYTARGYGVFDQVREQFTNIDDPFEYVPVRLRALTSRNGKVQESATGYYPHAGLLSTFQYLRRYPTTDTNRNRLRARMYYQHFLGIDVMALAPRVTDAAAVSAEYDNPTMQAADCVVCHRSVDPVAGLFQDFNMDGHLGPRKEGWYTDMFGPGLEREKLPDTERWRALPWLGERTARDPRFATAMVEHVYFILTGRRPLLAPEDIDDPHFEAHRRAYREQRQLIADVAQQFTEAKFNLKVVFKALIASPFYRADGIATAITDPCRRAELDDIGLVRLLTPEQLERKIEAIFGERWGKLIDPESQLKILYGGIDSESVTERMLEPSGAMGAIQRIMANEIACHHVATDFTRKSDQRRLFPNIEPDVVPGDGPEAEKSIRAGIVHLHRHILGRDHTIDHPEVNRTYRLFADIVADAKATPGVERLGSYFCERVGEKRIDDPNYTLRGWRAVVTYLLRQHDFLYE